MAVDCGRKECVLWRPAPFMNPTFCGVVVCTHFVRKGSFYQAIKDRAFCVQFSPAVYNICVCSGMSRKFIVCDNKNNPRYELDADELTLLFLDTLMALLNAGTVVETSADSGYADYFECNVRC